MARGLDERASDYLVKPFSPLELAARILLALRRRDTPNSSAPYVLDDLTIDYAERRVNLDGCPVTLIGIEFRTLAELSSNDGRVLIYEHLMRKIWWREADADLRPMRTAINSLRSKLGDHARDPTYIFTELSVGYRMLKGKAQEIQEAQTDAQETSTAGMGEGDGRRRPRFHCLAGQKQRSARQNHHSC